MSDVDGLIEVLREVAEERVSGVYYLSAATAGELAPRIFNSRWGQEQSRLVSERDGYRSAADVLGQSTKALKAERDRLVSENAALRERVEALEAALRRVRVNHYEPQFGGYCWCLSNRTDATDEHDARCLEARAALAAHEPQGPS